MARKRRKSETRTVDKAHTRKPSVPIDTNLEVLPAKSTSGNGTLLSHVRLPRVSADAHRMFPKAERSQGKSESA
jgi:hypothetical protein